MKIKKRNLAFTLIFILLLGDLIRGQAPPVNPNPYVPENMVEDNWFNNSIYYKILEAFWDGMGWKDDYPNADSCRVAVSDFFNDFYFLNVNHTATGDK